MDSRLYVAPEIVKHKEKIISFDFFTTQNKYNNCFLTSHDEFVTKNI